MKDEAMISLDEAIENDWATWRLELSSYVEGMADGAILTIDVRVGQEPDEGCAPWIQVLKDGDVLCAAVPGNDYLAAPWAHDASNHRRLARWFRKPGSPTRHPAWGGRADCWVTEFDEPDGDDALEVAHRVVKALRRVFGVIDPSLLMASGSDDEGRSEALNPRSVTRTIPAKPKWYPPQTQHPESPDELGDLVRQSLCAHLKSKVRPDADGDYLVALGDCPVWVSTPEIAPMVQFEGVVLNDVDDRWEARRMVKRLNRIVPGTLRVDGGQVRVRFVAPAAPYDHEQFLAALRLVEITIEHASASLREHVGGTSPGEAA